MITGTRKENLAALIKINDHELVSGVSEKLGGNNEGPTPHELLESALAACTIITVQMYANRKQWNLKSTNVAVKIISEDKTGTVIQRDVSFEGDLTSEQKQSLLDIANKCPVHKLLSGPIEIKTLAV